MMDTDFCTEGTEQSVTRHPRGLPHQVPQRDVHGADLTRGDGPRHGPERGVDPSALQRVPSHQQRLEEADQPRLFVLRRGHGRAEEGISFYAGVRADAEQPERGGAASHRRAGGVAGFGYPIPGEKR